MTSGGSVLETCAALKSIGVEVTQAVVLLDREQGGSRNLHRQGVALTSVLTMTQLLEHLEHTGKITKETVAMVKAFLSENSAVNLAVPSVPTRNSAQLSYTERAQTSSNALTKRLLNTIDQKASNLALSADVSNSSELLEVRK